LGSARVLVVDDDKDFLDAISRKLSRVGYEVLAAAGSCQALEIITTAPPVNVLLCDVMMPDMLGTELVRELARMSPDTAVVMMTGWTDLPDVPVDLLLLRKPFSTKDLVSVVELSLAQKVRQRQS
jgi:DNA-binding NtrC family response regulator